MAVKHEIEIYCGADIEKNPVTRPYIEDEVYLISDELPALILRCKNNNKLKSKELINLEKSKRLELGLTDSWYSYPVYKQKDISTERRFGLSCFVLDSPKVAINYYVIPSKILSSIDVLWMIRDIEKMFDSFQVWADDDSRMRAYANFHEYNSFIAQFSTMIKYVKEELSAAQALTRSPYKEIHPNKLSHIILPENNLVTNWAIKRNNELVLLEDKLRVNAAELRTRSPNKILPMRLKELNSRLERNKLLQDDLGTIVAKLSSYIKDAPSSIELSPAMQRDYRLRGLLRAFAPPKKEALTFDNSFLSTLPPIRLPDLFEIWCSVILIRWFEALGFQVSSSRSFKDEASGRLVGSLGEMLFEDVIVTLNYEEQPRRIQNIPKNTDRADTALKWAGRTQCEDDDLFGIVNQCTPDFIIKITGPKGYALAVGDATLADPQHTKNAGTKEGKLNTYRYGLGWRIGGETIGCHAQGIFLMYPGPHDQWSNLEEKLSEYDCYLFSPTATNELSAPPESFRHMINSLISSVSITERELYEIPSKGVSIP